MDPTSELADVVDLEDNVIGVASRHEVRAEKLLHRCACILCRDEQGRIFVHRRTESKDVFPGMYDMFIAGMLQAGETYEAGARRELEEEVGIRDAELRHVLTYRYDGKDNPSFNALFECVIGDEPRLQEDEIAWGAFLEETELLERLADWPFVPDGLELFHHYRSLRSS